MADKLDAAAQKMIDNLESKTGVKLDQWINIVSKSGLVKHREILNFLKKEHSLTHGYANLVTMKARDHMAAASGETNADQDPVDAQYAGGKSGLRPIYDGVMAAVSQFGDDVVVSPKKAYVSLRRGKQFAIVQPSTKTRVDIGINLKGDESTDRLEPSGRFNSMVSHRVRMTAVDQIDDELIGWLKAAYDRAA